MLLVIDAGNTNITCGIYDHEQLKTTFRLTTKQARTADEFGLDFWSLIEMSGLNVQDINAAIIASVVPGIMHSLTQCIRGYLKTEPLIVDSGLETGIRVAIPNPSEMGPDRIADAAAAFGIYGGPVLICDFGTATTFDLVNEKGELTAAITAPGLKSSAKALYGEADMLPAFTIEKPASILANNTITSLQAGLVYGYIGSAEYIVKRVKKESGYKNLRVVATGGLGKVIINETDVFDDFDMELTLKGLRMIYERNQRI